MRQSRSAINVRVQTQTHLVLLGDEVVYDEHLEPQLSAELPDVLQEALDLSVMLLLQICHLTHKTATVDPFVLLNSAFSVYAPLIWNKLPAYFFKSRIKTFLFAIK